MSLNKQQKYWENPNDKPNKPKAYSKHKERSDFLVNEIIKILQPEESILELGCNVGRNLHYLFKSGYENLSAIEINKKALKLLFKKYPELSEIKDKIKNNTIENEIKDYEDNSFDLVFSLAVLMHLPYESNFVLKEIVRISKKYILIIEDERQSILGERHFPRDYKKEFELSGFKQIKECFVNVKYLESYTMRLFIKGVKDE